MQSRADKIKERRLRQPIEELERKADKSHERANIWTQEEIDLCNAKARDLSARLNWE